MRIIRERYEEEIRRKEEKIKNIGKIEEECREEKRLVEDEMRLIEEGKRELINNITELKKQINKIRRDKEIRAEYEEIITKSREDNKRIKDLKDENDELKKSIHQMRAKERSPTNSGTEQEKQRSEISATELEKQTSAQK